MKKVLGEICVINKGKTAISKAEAGDYPLITTADVYKSSSVYDFDCKAVCIPLVSSTGHGHASINRLHYYDGKFALGTILAQLTSVDESLILTEYLYIYLSTFKDELLVPLMRGSANVSLTITSLKTVEIEIPSLDFQNKIIEIYRLCQELKSKAEEQVLNIEQLLKSSLVEAFNNGEI